MIRILRRIFLIVLIGAVVLFIVAQATLSFLSKTLLEREGRHLLQVPIYMDQAGANLLGGDFWMKGVRVKNIPGFEEPDLLSARTIAIDFNMLSLLTNEFAIRRILFKDPEFTLEVNNEGRLNLLEMVNRVLGRFDQLLRRKPRWVQRVNRYLLEKFAVRNGTLRFVDPQDPEKSWAIKSVSFSLARILYPPDLEEALPAAIYMSATISGAQEGKILILGRLNPFQAKKSFDITGSAKGLSLSPYSSFFQDFPLTFAGGTFQLKMKALCHENQVDILNQVRVEHLEFRMKESPVKKPPLAFGLPPETVAHFSKDLKPATEPFEFEFRVTGDLGDPKFDLLGSVRDGIHQAVSERVSRAMKAIERKAEEVLPQDAGSSS